MRHRISCCVFVMAAVAAFYGSVTAQSLNYSDAVTVPQVDSKMPQMLSDRQLKGDVLDSHDTQVGRNVGPNEAVFVNDNAKIKYAQGGDDLIKNPSGDVVGKSWNSGKVEWNCKHEDDCKSTLATGSKSGNLDCMSKPGQCAEKAVKDGTRIFSTLAEAVLAAKSQFAGVCSAESSYKVLRTKGVGTDGKHGYLVAFRGYYRGAEAKDAAPADIGVPQDEEVDFEVVAILHNHPKKDDSNYQDWFSTQDAILARKNNMDMILYGCTTDVFLWLHADQRGIVTRIEKKSDGKFSDGDVEDLPEEYIIHPIEELDMFFQKVKELYIESGGNRVYYHSVKELKESGYKYFAGSTDAPSRIYKDYKRTTYNPRDWDKLSSCEMNEECNGIEGVRVKLDEGKLDFYSLVPDKIWTEPIIGALVACEGCGNRKVDWWGAKWMGGCFDPTPAHDDLTFEHHSVYGSYKHLVGFTLNTCVMPKVYVSRLSEFSLSDAQSIEEKVRLWIEENVGIKLSKKTLTEDVKHESYVREYSCVSEYCRVYFKNSINAGGHRWIQKHGEKGRYEKVIRLEMNIRVYCSDWYDERVNFDRARYSVRDLLQGKVKKR